MQVNIGNTIERLLNIGSRHRFMTAAYATTLAPY